MFKTKAWLSSILVAATASMVAVGTSPLWAASNRAVDDTIDSVSFLDAGPFVGQEPEGCGTDCSEEQMEMLEAHVHIQCDQGGGWAKWCCYESDNGQENVHVEWVVCDPNDGGGGNQ